MKKMPHTVKLSIFLVILGIVCAGILAGVNRFTAPVIKANQQKELEKTLAAVGVKNPEVLEGTFVEGITAAYSGQTETGNACYAFQIVNKNQFTTITTLIVIETANAKLSAIAIVSGTPGITTHGKDAQFKENQFGVIGATSSDYESKFVGVSGATISSSSVKTTIKIAYEQFSQLA